MIKCLYLLLMSANLVLKVWAYKCPIEWLNCLYLLLMSTHKDILVMGQLHTHTHTDILVIGQLLMSACTNTHTHIYLQMYASYWIVTDMYIHTHTHTHRHTNVC